MQFILNTMVPIYIIHLNIFNIIFTNVRKIILNPFTDYILLYIIIMVLYEIL